MNILYVLCGVATSYMLISLNASVHLNAGPYIMLSMFSITPWLLLFVKSNKS